MRELISRNVGMSLNQMLIELNLSKSSVWTISQDLKEVVSNFVESLDDEVVKRAVRDVRTRAELCLKMGGSHFKSQLKKYKRGTIEE